MKTYFVQKQTSGSIKIGKSKNVPSRLMSLQHLSEERLVLLLATNAVTEKDMHERFAADRLVGEWFHPDAILAALPEIAALPEREEVIEPMACEKKPDQVKSLSDVLFSAALQDSFDIGRPLFFLLPFWMIDPAKLSHAHLVELVNLSNQKRISPAKTVEGIVYDEYAKCKAEFEANQEKAS